MEQVVTPAMYRTLVEAMGMQKGWISSKLGVNLRNAGRFATMNHNDPIPQFAQEWLLDWWQWFQDEVAETVDAALDLAEEHDETPHVALVRYRGRQAIRRAGEKLPLSMHDALLRLTLFALGQADITAHLTWEGDPDPIDE